MNYLYSRNFDSQEGLQLVIEAIETFSKERYLYAIFQTRRRFTIQDAVKMDGMVLQVLGSFESEYYRLREFAEHFNGQFVTKNNKCFNLAHAMLMKIHSATKEYKYLHNRFTPNSSPTKRNLPNHYTQSSIIEHSPIGLAPYVYSLYPLEQFPVEVQQLFIDMNRFYRVMYDAVVLCLDMIREEEAIRRDPAHCLQLYHDFKEDNSDRIRLILNAIDLRSPIFSASQSPAIAMREQYNTEDKFAQQGFHNLELDDVCRLSAKEMAEEAQRGGITNDESYLFEHNKEKIPQIRKIISTFDQFLPPAKKVKKIPARMIASLELWTGAAEEKSFVRYFKTTYQNAGGSWEVPTSGAVNHVKFSNKDDREYKELAEKWEKIDL